MSNTFENFMKQVDELGLYDTPLELDLANAEAQAEYREATLQTLLADLERRDIDEQYAAYLASLGI